MQLVVGERFAEFGLDQSEDQQRDPDDAGQRVDAVVVVQEDRADFEGLFVVAVAALDDLLAFVVAQQLPGGQPRAGEVGRQRVEPVGLGGGGDRVVVARPGERGLAVAGGGGGADQPFDVGSDDPGDAGLDLLAGLVVAPAEPVLDALQLLFGLAQRALAGGGGLALLLGGVDVGDAEAAGLAGLGVGDIPVSECAAVFRAQLWRERSFAC